jgi:3',5'-cyclic-AMP phosphodiesterase
MRRFVWTSDIHLDRMEESEFSEFTEYLEELNADGFILAGDIAEADSVAGFLKKFSERLDCPIYFVLGNHDFWGSTFVETRAQIRQLVSESTDLHWLSESGIIPLNEMTALIGHEGWADGGYAPVPPAGTVPLDFRCIEDLKKLRRDEFQAALGKLGEDAAEYLGKTLREAIRSYRHIYLVTHVPPFKEASLDRARRICGDERLPFYSCKAIGDILREIMSQNPECRLTVLCGHTHEKCEMEILPNLEIKILDAGYGTWYPPGSFKV